MAPGSMRGQSRVAALPSRRRTTKLNQPFTSVDVFDYTVNVLHLYNIPPGSFSEVELDEATQQDGASGMGVDTNLGSTYVFIPAGITISLVKFSGLFLSSDTLIELELRAYDNGLVDILLEHEDSGAGSSITSFMSDSSQPSATGTMPFTVPVGGAYVGVRLRSTDGNSLSGESKLTISWS